MCDKAEKVIISEPYAFLSWSVSTYFGKILSPRIASTYCGVKDEFR